MTAYWAKGRNKRYPYYECFNKQCDERRKSIRKEVLEAEFEALIKQLRPSAGIISTVAAMFRDIWGNRIQRLEEKWKEQKQALTGINTTIGKLTDRLIETTSTSAIHAYETKLEKVEAEKALIVENLAQKPDLDQGFDISFRTARRFSQTLGIFGLHPTQTTEGHSSNWYLQLHCHMHEIRDFEPLKLPVRSKC